MLLGNFFNITDQQLAGNTATVTIAIDPSHEIFKGHFPGQPVVPGVCMVQMIKEILQIITGEKLQLTKAAELKFLAIIDPLQDPSVQVVFTYDKKEDHSIAVTGRIFREETTFLKFKANYRQSA